MPPHGTSATEKTDPPRKKIKIDESPPVPDEQPGSFERLPTDIFRYILSLLEPCDRLALAITCKRLHLIDREIGRWKIYEFQHVHVTSIRFETDIYKIEGIDSQGETSNYTCGGTNERKQTEKTFINAGFFQRATVDHLQLTLEKASAIDSLSFIFAFTQFKKLTVKVKHAKSISAQRLVASLLNGQEYGEMELDIAWMNCSSNSFNTFRNSILSLDKVRKIRVDLRENRKANRELYKKCEYPLNDACVNYLVKTAEQCQLGLGNISAKCILDLFEICFETTGGKKTIELLTEESTIDELKLLVRNDKDYYWENFFSFRDSRLRRGDGRNCTCLIIEKEPFHDGGTEFYKSRGPDYPYRRVTVKRVPPYPFAFKSAFAAF